MTVVFDTSGLYAALNPRERTHEACRAALRDVDPPFVLSPFVLAELDYLLLTRAGVDVELRFLDDLGRGAYLLAPFVASDVARASAIARAHRDLELGAADASVLVLCERHETADVLTLDQRPFRSTSVRGKPLRLLPLDIQP